MIIEKELVVEIETRYNNGEPLKLLLEEKKLTSNDFYSSKDLYNPKLQDQVDKNLNICEVMENRLFFLISLFNDPQTHKDSKKKLGLKIDNLSTFYSKANPLIHKDVMCPTELIR